jgi:hypothetical protein
VDVIVTAHARFEIQRRGIEETDVITLINKPQQRIPSLKGRMILQNKYFDKTEGKDMLLRVIGKESPKGFVLITAYKTSKIEKYWMKEEL